MACRPLPGGGFACDRSKRQSCSAPGCSKWASKLCDFPVHNPKKKSRTCDAPMCDQHATSMGKEIDYCPPHARYVRSHEGGE